MSTEVQAYDYAALGDLAMPMKGIAEAIHNKYGKAVNLLSEVGSELNSAVNLFRARGDSAFDAWIRAEFDMSRSTAYRIISVYHRWPEGIPHGARFDKAALYLLASDSTPDEVVHAAVARAEAGERISKADVKEIADELSEANADPSILTSENETESQTDGEPWELLEGPAAPAPSVAADPHGHPAPLWSAIGGSIDSVKERFEANAQPGYECAMFLSHWAAARKAFAKYVEVNEKN